MASVAPVRELPREAAPWPRWLMCSTAALVLLGAAWRAARYLAQFPLWGDEAFVCVNLLDRDYLGLTGELRFAQVAPVLFLWAEKASFEVLGGSELALRLLPFLAGLAALALLALLARRALNPLAAALAVGVLAVAYYPVRHSCEVKPYAFDLLLSVALLLAAVRWLDDPRRLGWLALLALLAPLAVGLSYPAVLTAGGVALALLPTAWRQGARARALYAAFGLALVGSFALVYGVVGRGQFASTGGAGNPFWEEWFPPSRPRPLLLWLADAHTGNMMAYPVGGRAGGSALTALLCLAGVWRLASERRLGLLALLLAPFGLTLLAAALQRYPYGGSARVAQHLAPAICLLAGAGGAAVLTSVGRSAAGRRRAALAAFGLLAVVGAAGLARDLIKPSKVTDDARVRAIVADVLTRAGTESLVVVQQRPRGNPTFEWYLRRDGGRVNWNGGAGWDRLGPGAVVWCLWFPPHAPGPDAPSPLTPPPGRRLVPQERTLHTLQLGQCENTVEHCEVSRWLVSASPE